MDAHENKEKKLTPGVYIRSQKLPIVKPTMQPKVIKVLEELGIGKMIAWWAGATSFSLANLSVSAGPRPIMPTQKICLKFEKLQNAILNMFELKKVVDKTEVEHKVKVTQMDKSFFSELASDNNECFF